MNSPVVFVTGALTGIGRATALAFANTGARVAVSGRRVAEGQVLERELQHTHCLSPARTREADAVVTSSSYAQASNPPHINPT
jgi:NAD(P)-dependent dehydrogenase (short-subunit alcohol dehydrogenase family)